MSLRGFKDGRASLRINGQVLRHLSLYLALGVLFAVVSTTEVSLYLREIRFLAKRYASFPHFTYQEWSIVVGPFW